MVKGDGIVSLDELQFLLTLFWLSFPFVIVLSEGFALRHLDWKPSPFRTSLVMFLASFAVAFILLYGGDYLLYALLGRDAYIIVPWLYPLAFISTFMIDGVILLRIGRVHYESRAIWKIVIVTNIIGYLIMFADAGLFLLVSSILSLYRNRI
ncbi:hypothetical protein MNBD_CHLOROFLEXI01-1476 [hydrothermal vent metagenome]|uniref:Uncharacterized protein n=1 Tax=hydrothermal vent metagenome TaxID=652676 RepID=A0A3B0VX05_9ZZZZ